VKILKQQCGKYVRDGCTEELLVQPRFPDDPMPRCHDAPILIWSLKLLNTERDWASTFNYAITNLPNYQILMTAVLPA
jgi:hypothetical protein